MKNKFWSDFFLLICVHAFFGSIFLVVKKYGKIEDEHIIYGWVAVTLICATGTYFLIKYLKTKYKQRIRLELSKSTGIIFPDFDNSSNRFKELLTSYKSLTNLLVKIVSPKINESHFLFAVFHGVINKLNKDLSIGFMASEGTYYMDSDFYGEILNLATIEDKIFAVADRQNTHEINLWDTLTNDQQTKVQERIFFIPWEVFFDAQRLEREFEIFKEQRNPIRYNHRPLKPFNQEFYDRIGYDFFLVEPDIVGYYAKAKQLNGNSNRTYLKIIDNKSICHRAHDEYMHWSSTSILFDDTKIRNIHELRREWINRNLFGKWTWHNTIVENRNTSYFLFYDIHIRCWIWLYNELTNQVIDTSKEIIRSLINNIPQIKVLEIGFGTGAVTLPLLSWINEINKRLEYQADRHIRFKGIDRASKQMVNELRKKGWDEHLKNHHELEEGAAWSSMKKDKNTKYHLVIASLVVHDIIENNAVDEFPVFLEEAKSHLTDNGVILIADIFPKENSSEIDKWINFMLDTGLNKLDVEEFKKYNPEMFSPLTLEKAINIGNKNGYDVSVHQLISENSKECPFRVLSFTRT